MTPDDTESDPSRDGVPTDEMLSPEEAFAVLGSDHRIAMLRALGEADGPLAFSDLRAAVGTRDSGQFSYHLNKLVGHFVRQTPDGYEIRRAGERVIEAVLSGAVTESPVRDATAVDRPCHYCGAPVEVRYHEDRIRVHCTDCEGIYGADERADGNGHLGTLPLPPAGVQHRTPAESLQAAYVWGELTGMASASGVCPRCSAVLDESVSVCADHEARSEPCEECVERYAVGIHFECTNCIYDRGGAFGVKLLTNTDLLAFLTARGINPVEPSARSAIGAMVDYEEEVLSTDPFEARFTFAVDGDTLSLRVGDDLAVVETTVDEAGGEARRD
ncbi:DUF7351 domain-containing protein [Halomarina rubra]|uniref:ArsR family transcriptional regulator n=1 Tax=Halomarina rubra TaxID=2071873 RepID=A0ABD6ARC2_9EURY|nr:hypothetical protein [Halomarina rubra]